MKTEKAAFENVIGSIAARNAATALLAFESLRLEETGRSPQTRLCYSDLLSGWTRESSGN